MRIYIEGSAAQAFPGAPEAEAGSKRPFWQAKLTVLVLWRGLELQATSLANKIDGSGAQAVPVGPEAENGPKRPFWQTKLVVLVSMRPLRYPYPPWGPSNGSLGPHTSAEVAIDTG